MAIQFIQKKKKQKYLILIFGAVLLITVVVLWYGFFRGEKIKPVVLVVAVASKEIKINFEFLESSVLKELQSFEEISFFDKEAGRKNPFLPYGKGLESETELEIGSEM